ncbi:MAG: four helix bundle protein [Dysgonamonadaceae bacterium]|jgi:four helix bundle protein|nr:four helix bundle protein [Dysgonamonadaceae bacterium]
MDSKFDYREQLKSRTKAIALRIIRLYRKLPKTGDAQVIGKQTLRSGTSLAANYRAACRARSEAEFFSKLSIVIEETDETMFWLELLWESEIIKKELLKDLYTETEEILKIMSTARKNSKKQINE